jgi:serine/threonine protein kinase
MSVLTKGELRERQSRIAGLMAKVARAVHFAHQRGILHRDLKPSNILIDGSGEPQVTDFGLAKRVAADGRLTLTGAILGSPEYMAPEQALGHSNQVTSAADIYSFGAILYELLAGRPPFQADAPLAIMRKTFEEEPKPPHAVQPGVDRYLEIICLKCLAKAPSDRYPSAEALADDLEHWIRREPISARRPTRWQRVVNHVRLHPIRAALTGIVLLALLLTATFFYASNRTYYWLMAKINDEHLIVPPGEDAVYRLKLRTFDDFRCTYNFWKDPFWTKRINLGSRYARFELTNLPPDLASQLTNGQIFLLGDSSVIERAYYFGAVNFQSSNVLARAPDATIHVILLGRPGDPDPYKATGALTERERY